MAFSVLHLSCLLFLCVLLPSWPLLVFSQSDSRIPLGSSLVASQDSSSWASPSGEFAFGFYPLDGQAHFLLAIWYEKIPEKTLVWYANGENPASEGSKIELTSKGQFILSDPKGNKIWEPDSAIDGTIAYAYMLDNGNFVLSNGSGNSITGYAWESFKNPSDTILPGQVMEIGGTLSSRRAEGNYSKGRFQLRLIPDGNFVLNTLDVVTDTPTDAYYWSNTYDGVPRRNGGRQVIFNNSGYLYVALWNGNNVYLRSENIFSTGDYYHRGTLDFDGIFTIYTRSKSLTNGNWVSSWSIPKDICAENWGETGSGICGFNTHCTLSNGRPICECLPGFSYIDSSNNFSGCKQDRPQKCELNPEDIYDKVELVNIFWPNSSDFEELRPLQSQEDCWKSCLYDCNCIVSVPNGDRCQKMRLPLTNGRVDGSTNRVAFVKVPKPDASSSCEPPIQNPPKEKKGQATLILVGSILLGGSLFLNFLLAAAVALVNRSPSAQKGQKLARESSILERNIRSFTYKELEEATDGFREVLGSGAFGTVYKGVLISSPTSRTQLAVKNLDRLAQELEKEFKTEASIIGMTHHKNLVRLLGVCDDGPRKLLVYEFMSNGTLASFLFGDPRPEWKKRIGLAFGIARGLMYLHEECSTQIIHCDIKPQNILLDDTFTARISDFGLAKLLMSDQSRTLTAIRGTKGYVAPEWFRNKPITAKVDVYSYGVLLLEIVICRKSLDFQPGKEEEAILTDWAYDCYHGDRVEKLVENDDEARKDIRMVERMVMLAIWCIQEDPTLRPSMRNVVQMLEGVAEVPAPPCPSPLYSMS